MFYSPTLGCSVCGNGLVAFVVAADGKQLVLFCIQCGTWYASVEHHNYQLLDSTAAVGPDLQLAGCDCSVKFPPARWATAEEVRDFGWGAYLNPEPNRWLPDQAWPAAEWEARLRGVDVWSWNAPQTKQPPPVAQPARRLLDQYGRPFDETAYTQSVGGAEGKPMRTDLAARLAAIGPYTTEQGEDPSAHEFNYVWKRLPQLRCSWCDFDLVFSVPADSVRVPDERMFELWEWYRGGHPFHAREFREVIIALSLGDKYDPDLPLPELTDGEMRRLVEGGTIRVFWQTQDAEEYDHGVDACFRFTPLHPDCHGGMIRTWDEETGSWEYVY